MTSLRGARPSNGRTRVVHLKSRGNVDCCNNDGVQWARSARCSVAAVRCTEAPVAEANSNRVGRTTVSFLRPIRSSRARVLREAAPKSSPKPASGEESWLAHQGLDAGRRAATATRSPHAVCGPQPRREKDRNELRCGTVLGAAHGARHGLARSAPSSRSSRQVRDPRVASRIYAGCQVLTSRRQFRLRVES